MKRQKTYKGKAYHYALLPALCIVHCALMSALVSCSTDDDLTAAYLSDPNAVHVNATIGSPYQTRVNTEGTGDEWQEKDQIYVENVSSNAISGKTHAAYKYSESDGWQLQGSDYMVWAGSNDSENTFEAYYPCDESVTTTSFTTFTLPSDQSSDVNNLRSADWMIAKTSCTKGKSTTNDEDAIDLEFNHQLARVTVVIDGYGGQYTNPELSDPKFTVPTTKTTITGKTISFDGTEVTAYKGTTTVEDEEKTSYTAVLMSGSYTAGGTFFTLTVGGDPLTVKVPSSGVLIKSNANGETGLESGKSYTFYVTVGKDELVIGKVEVKDWNTGTLEKSTGISDEVPIIGTKTADQGVAIGDYFMSDGSLVGSGETLTETQKNSCIGVVFSTDANRIGEAEKTALSNAGVTTPHGLVLAKTNATTENVRWGPDEYDTDLSNIGSMKAAYEDISGLANCKVIWETKDDNGDLKYTLSDYPAFEAAKNYGNTVAAPSGTTGWFMPSIGQWWDVLRNIGNVTGLDDYKNNESDTYMSFSGTDMRTNFNKIKTVIGGDDMSSDLWSSSEYTYQMAYCLINNSWNQAGICWGWRKAQYPKPVRCVLAF